MTYRENRNIQVEDDIIFFAYAYGTVERDQIIAGVPEASGYTQEELEAIIFLDSRCQGME